MGTPGWAPGERGHAKLGRLKKQSAMLLLAISLASLAISLGEDITVNLSKGKLRGARLDYDFGQYYYAFKGIPYARPPVKELRFKVTFSTLFIFSPPPFPTLPRSQA